MQNEDTTKYIIRTKITADGVIERPDIVGAIFGQTEGLLGTDLDLRELQKTGRIGRIEVMVTTKNGKTRGNIFIPSSLDKVKTSVLAASLETIDRVGPCVAKIEVTKIEDVRASKRVDIVERAKNIYKTMFDEDLLEAQEITDVIRESVRVEGITSYGKNKLPAGPEYNSNEIIVVEGRADVLTLLKYGIKNTISVGGTNIPSEVVDLLKGKKVTVFTDGDRGGELIIRELIQLTNVDSVARPPDGKAVEDLIQKEIVMALRRKMTTDQYIEKFGIVLPASKRTKRVAEPESGAIRSGKPVEKTPSKRVTPIRKSFDEEEEKRAEPVRKSRTERLTDKPERTIERSERVTERPTRSGDRPERNVERSERVTERPTRSGDRPERNVERSERVTDRSERTVGRSTERKSFRNAEESKQIDDESEEYPIRQARQIRSRSQSQKPNPEEIDDQISVRYVDLDKESLSSEEKPRRGRRNAVQADEEEAEKAPRRNTRERGFSKDREPGEREFSKERDFGENRRSKREEESFEKKPSIPAPFDSEMEAISGTLTSKVLDKDNAVIFEMPVRDLAGALKNGINDAETIIFDGMITQRIVDIAADQGIKNLVGLKTGNVVKIPADMKIFAAQN